MGFALPSPDELPESDDDLELGELNDPAIFKDAFGRLLEQVDKGTPDRPLRRRFARGEYGWLAVMARPVGDRGSAAAFPTFRTAAGTVPTPQARYRSFRNVLLRLGAR